MTNEDSNSPRVLVLSAAALSRTGATGITLSNLFDGWPRDKLAQIYADSVPPDPLICSNSYPFSSDQIGIIRAARTLRRRISGGRQDSGRLAENRHGIFGGSVKGNMISSFADSAPFRLPHELLESVTKFDPQIIYSPLGSIRMMRTALQLSERFNIPVVPHFMDDWPSTVYSTGAIYLPLRLMLRNMLGKVLSRAPFGLTICEDMSEEYARRYGMRFEAFMNCVEICSQSIEKRRTSGQVAFGYVGGLHLNRWKSLRDVTAALQSEKDRGCDVRLDIFAPEADIRAYKGEFDAFTVLRNFKSLRYSSVREQLREYDVLIHVESFLPEDSRYTRLSISTKIPQYMAAGRPILAYGPKTLSSIAYISRTGAGLAVTSEGDVRSLLDNVRRLITRPDLREQLGSAGRTAALSNHDAVLERQRLMRLLAEAAANAEV